MFKITAPQWATFSKKKKNEKKKNEKKPKKSKKVGWANEAGGKLEDVRYVTPTGKMAKTGAAQSTTRGGSLTTKQRLALGGERASAALASVRRDIAQATHDSNAAKKKLASDVADLRIARSMKLGGKNLSKFENAVRRSENKALEAEISKNLAKMKSKSTRAHLL
jgi:hypothetical protein